jgi:hypothetical protein
VSVGAAHLCPPAATPLHPKSATGRLTWTAGAVVRCGRAEEEAEGWGWLDGERYLQRWDVPWGWATLVFGLVSWKRSNGREHGTNPYPIRDHMQLHPKHNPKESSQSE